MPASRSTHQGTHRVHLSRRIAADPTSTALLLAGPAAIELWPGVRRLGEVGGRELVEADLGDGAPTAPVSTAVTAASVTAGPPRRTPTAFVSRFSWTGPDLPLTTGVLTLTYAPGAHAVPSTVADLVLDAEALAGSRLDEAALTALARGFLGNLGAAAEQRRSAA